MKETKIRLAGIGEVLMDRFEDGEATLGGAPLNVTFHLHQLLVALEKGDAAMVSAVGKDAWGDRILKELQTAGMDTTWVRVDEQHPTGAAMVFEKHGEAGFEILPDVAWDFIQDSTALEAFAKESDAVVFGSLAQRSPVSKHTIQNFVTRVHGPRFYDVNLRRNTTNGVAGYSKEVIEESLKLATIVKMNDSELEEIAKIFEISNEMPLGKDRVWSLMKTFQQRFDLEAMAVTRGAEAALLLGGSEQLETKDSTLDQDKVHPVGAGDAFSAGLLVGVVLGWSFQSSIALADLMSSWVVSHVSATPALTPEMIAKVKDLCSHATTARHVVPEAKAVQGAL